MKAILLSVKPHFANALVHGTKTCEVRRRFPALSPGTLVYLYSSSPERKVIGRARLASISTLSPPDVWRLHSSEIGIDRKFLFSYLEGVQKASLLFLDSPELWPTQMPLSLLRNKLELEPPQSFRYLDAPKVLQLESWKNGSLEL